MEEYMNKIITEDLENVIEYMNKIITEDPENFIKMMSQYYRYNIEEIPDCNTTTGRIKFHIWAYNELSENKKHHLKSIALLDAFGEYTISQYQFLL
jgi:hypothetical protein